MSVSTLKLCFFHYLILFPQLDTVDPEFCLQRHEAAQRCRRGYKCRSEHFLRDDERRVIEFVL